MVYATEGNTNYFYRPQRSWAKVISLQASVCPHRGVCLVPGGNLVRSRGVYLADTLPPRTRCPPWDQVPPQTRYTPLRPGIPPQTRYIPRDQVHPPGPGTTPQRPGIPPRTRYTPPPNTDNERPVRILLECILVSYRVILATWENC